MGIHLISLNRLVPQIAGKCLPFLKKHPGAKRLLLSADIWASVLRQSIANVIPAAIRPRPRTLGVAVTAACNQRCIGCKYGREFMPNQQIPFEILKHAIDDAKAAGFWNMLLYGGEPLLHPELPQMVEYSFGQGLPVLVVTNGVLLKEKIDELYNAGLRNISIGFYGVGDKYNKYVQREDSFERLEAGLAYTREKYGTEIKLAMHWLLTRPVCTVEDLNEAWGIVQKYSFSLFNVDLVHYSLPYFTEGPDRYLQFKDGDRPMIEEVVRELKRLKQENPDIIGHTDMGLNSIPDWLMLGPEMKVPCDRHVMVWIGADGSIQLCPVQFEMGNLHNDRLKDILFSKDHIEAARDCFNLNCPNCHYCYDARVQKNASSRFHYSRGIPPLAG